MTDKPIRGRTFAALGYDDRIALLHRLQSGAPIWIPHQSGPRVRPIVKPVLGDKNPQGKAAQRRQRQMLKAGKPVVIDEVAEIPQSVWSAMGVAPLPERQVVTRIASSVASDPGKTDTPGIQATPED